MEKLELSFYKLHFSIFGRDPEKSKKIDEFNFKKKMFIFFSNTKAKTGKQNN